MELLLVGIGGFFGAIARYLVYTLERSVGIHSFPFGTLIINLIGCMIAGALLAMVERDFLINKNFILLSSMGFIGAFTTFSTFSVETLQLIRSDQAISAMINIAANTTLGVGAVWFGRRLLTGL